MTSIPAPVPENVKEAAAGSCVNLRFRLPRGPSTRLGSASLPAFRQRGREQCSPIQPTSDLSHGVRRPGYQMELLLMATGTVKWFNAQKGYGFIQPTNGGADVFVHISAVERAGMDGLQEGQKLNYELEQGQRGRVSAVNLHPA